MKQYKITSFVLTFLFATTKIVAQETVVVGQVMDKYDKKPLESVSVYFEGSERHTQTNKDGYFLVRNKGKQTNLVFSLIGYKKEKITVKRGSNVAINIELEENIDVLNEILVKPSKINPALKILRKVRKNRDKNNVNAPIKGVEQNVVFLSKAGDSWKKNQIFKKLSESNISVKDSLLLLPIYMKEIEFHQNKNSRKVISENRFKSSETSILSIESLLRRMDKRVNFYDNSINIMGKSMISPLANMGNSFYRYYLIDSIFNKQGRKEYLIHFRTKNSKNLAFNGAMTIDSITYALTHITAQLPRQANLNFIHNLKINQTYAPFSTYFTLAESNTTWYLTYELFNVGNNRSAELLLKNSIRTELKNKINNQKKNLQVFADTDYSAEVLENKMTRLHKNSIFKVVSYLADIGLTNYMKVGKIDIGRMDNIIQHTSMEGYRFSFPFRTNEDFSKKIMIGAFAGYGISDNKWKYGINLAWKPAFLGNKTILGTSYVDDYRDLQFEYSKFLWYNNPLAMSGRNFISQLLSLGTMNSYVSRRKEFAVSIKHDWSKNFESGLVYRNITYLPNQVLTLTQQTNSYSELRTQTMSLVSRFAFNEKVYYDHFQKLYLSTKKPVLYTVFDAGNYHLSKDKKGNYARLTANVFQQQNFILGKWRYGIEVGKVFGKVPYPLLHKFKKMSAVPYHMFRFYTMSNNEYISDTYVTAMGEINFNGILFNYIPLIKHLNLREIFGLKMAYGTLSDKHNSILDIPTYTNSFNQPYVEASVGFTNLFNILSMQFIGRVTDWKDNNENRWFIETTLRINL
ncbi:MAG: hypothetical protein CR965_00380 [Paludibacter sp.]|nr:MAG: hypothetical protein CR965_00380 [Paludibacter sp.]